MKYHIVITNNETGEVELDTNADAILASMHDEEYTQALTLIDCNGVAYVETVAGLFKLLDQVKEGYPLEYTFAKAFTKVKQKEKENNENE